MSSLQADNFQQSRKVRVAAPAVRFSRRALVALGLGAVAWALPLAPAVVVFLAVTALGAIRHAPKRNVNLRGGAFAKIALALGIAGLAAQGYVVYRGVSLYQQMAWAPTEALAQGLDGDRSAFLDIFPQASGQADAADVFLGELETRYGPLIHAKPKASPDLAAALRGEHMTQSYRLQFERGIVTAEADLQPQPGDALRWPASPRVASLTILDPDRGQLAFPETRFTGVDP
ncbi:MAG: hypothetical protein AAF333_02990 [Planctomycetota bacterium]